MVLGKRLRGDAKRRTPVEPVLDDVTVSVPLALVAPVAATEKSTCPVESADMPTTTFQPEDALPAITKRPSFGVTDGVTLAGTLEMADTSVPAAAFHAIEGAFGERARVGAAADTVRVTIDDEAVPPVPVANS